MISFIRSWFKNYKKKRSKKNVFNPYDLKNLSDGNLSATIISSRSPNAKDNKPDVGQRWVNEKTAQIFMLKTKKVGGIAVWEEVDPEHLRKKND